MCIRDRPQRAGKSATRRPPRSSRRSPMSAVVGATSPADFHTAVGVQVEALLEAAARGSLPGTASDALVRWCDAELIPHALAEEQAMYPEAHEDPRARLLVEAMLAEYLDLVALVDAIRQATGPVRAAGNAQALRSLFESHVVQENDQVLPLMAESSQVSLAIILDGLHEPLGGGQGQSCLLYTSDAADDLT